MAPRKATVLKKLRKICLELADTTEEEKWGKPHFCVKGKIFAGFGETDDGEMSIGFKLEMENAEQLIQVPGIERAPYVGHKGWVSLDPKVHNDWSQLEEWIHESYCLIATKRSRLKSGFAE